VINLGPDGLSERCEVVDGKQRITACLMWERGEIPGVLGDGREIWRGDLDGPSVIQTKTLIGMRYGCVHMTRTEALELYIRINAGGTVHSAEEIDRVRGLLAEEQGR